MAEKIYENNKQVNSNITVNDVKTLTDIIWKEIATTSGRGSVSIFSSNKADYLKKRQAEIEKGYLTKEEYDWFINKYFKALPNWHSLYLMQVVKYDIATYSAYSNYLLSYKAIQSLYSTLKTIKPNEESIYSIKDLSDIWLSTWSDFYTKCDDLDSVIIAKIKETSIQKAITEYSINQSNDVPPTWKTEEDDKNWSTNKPQKLETYQALWARTKYYYLDNSITRNRPYLISKATTKKEGEGEEEKISSAISLYLSRDTARWSARGLKVEKEIIMTCIYEDILKVTYELSYGSGITFADTEVDNEKRIITPTLASEMSDQIIIRAFVVDSQNSVIAEATTTLKKEIIGTTDPTYIGCLETVPSGYTHDGIVDNLIKGDYFLCKGKTGTDPDSDFMFGIIYELVDPNSFTSRSAWQICTDTDKIAKTISDSIAIGAYSQENGTFNNLIVNKSSILSGELTINVEESKFKHILPLENETYNIGSSDLNWLYAYIKNLISERIDTAEINISGQKKFNIQGNQQPYLICVKRRSSSSGGEGVMMWSNGFMIQYNWENDSLSGSVTRSWRIPWASNDYAVAFIPNENTWLNNSGGIFKAFLFSTTSKGTFTRGRGKTNYQAYFYSSSATSGFCSIAMGEADSSQVSYYLNNPTYDFN